MLRTNLSINLIEWTSRKRRHVCRATYSAELFAAVDTTDTAVLINLALHEIMYGVQSLDTLRALREEGGFGIPSFLLIDAKSVFDSLTVEYAKTPAEKSVLVQVLWLREILEKRILNYLVWLDTRDMLPDGLTKGAIHRELLHKAMNGFWHIKQAYKIFAATTIRR